MSAPGNKWYAPPDRQNNATATATKAAVANQQHVITGIYCAFSGTATKTVVIKQGSTAIMTLDVVNSLSLVGIEIPIAMGSACSAELAASGSAGVYGSVALFGYSE